MLLNCSASPSSSSPVCTAMRSVRLPSPNRAAPACSARIGFTMVRARIRLTITDRAMPTSSRSTVRRTEASRGAKASSSGSSTKTVQRSDGIVTWAVSTR